MSKETETEELLSEIVESLQEKKGHHIVTLDLRKIGGSICDFFVICEGGTPTQVSALSDSVWERVQDNLKEKPLGVVGQTESQWVAMDYGTIIVHIFLPDTRAFYNLENLWADAETNQIPEVV